MHRGPTWTATPHETRRRTANFAAPVPGIRGVRVLTVGQQITRRRLSNIWHRSPFEGAISGRRLCAGFRPFARVVVNQGDCNFADLRGDSTDRSVWRSRFRAPPAQDDVPWGTPGEVISPRVPQSCSAPVHGDFDAEEQSVKSPLKSVQLSFNLLSYDLAQVPDEAHAP